MTSKIKNVQELKQELLRVSEEEPNNKAIALALAYLLSELCPTDRTTKHVKKRAQGNEDAKTE